MTIRHSLGIQPLASAWCEYGKLICKWNQSLSVTTESWLSVQIKAVSKGHRCYSSMSRDSTHILLAIYGLWKRGCFLSDGAEYVFAFSASTVGPVSFCSTSLCTIYHIFFRSGLAVGHILTQVFFRYWYWSPIPRLSPFFIMGHRFSIEISHSSVVVSQFGEGGGKAKQKRLLPLLGNDIFSCVVSLQPRWEMGQLKAKQEQIRIPDVPQKGFLVS